MSFAFGADTFSTSDIKTPLGEVLVVLTATSDGQQLQFSNVNSFGGGPYAGSIDLVASSGAILSFEPPGFDGGGLNLFFEDPSGGMDNVSGDYLATATFAVPEFASWIAMLPGLVGLFFTNRRGKSTQLPEFGH